jgi:RAB6A-GEF complex partner protein 1
MYWPIGAPRLYAAGKLDLGHAETNESDITVESTTDKIITAKETTSTHTRKASRRPTLLRNANSGGAYGDDLSGEIVGMKLSRNGHLFVTITATTLTVWQTKVSLFINESWDVADLRCSSPLQSSLRL